MRGKVRPGSKIKLIAGRAVAKAKAAAKRFRSWSFSRYNEYRRCPLFAKLKHLDKVEEPGSEAMDRGAAIGQAAERFIRGDDRRLHEDLRSFRILFVDLRRQYRAKPGTVVAEETWAFTKDWKVTRYNDWDNCVVRIKIDVARFLNEEELEVIDWKTGKFDSRRNQEYVEQLELYALGALLKFPDVRRVHCRLAYTDLGITFPAPSMRAPVPGATTFTRDDAERLRKTWEGRTRPMLADVAFRPRPNDKCRWCYYGQAGRANGGPGLCKY